MVEWLLGLFSREWITPPPQGPAWECLIQNAIEQDIIGVLFHSIFLAPAWTHPPDTIGKEIRRLYHQQSVHHLHYEHQICQIRDACEQEGIRYLLMKGLALGYQVYEKPAIRPFRDIDLYTHADNMNQVAHILGQIGYLLVFNGHNISPDMFYHQVFLPPSGSNYKPIELHWRPLDLPDRDQGISFNDLYTKSDCIPIASGTIRTFSLCDAFIYACMHAGIHHAGEIRLIWIADIFRLIREISNRDAWPQVMERIEWWHAGAAVQRTVQVASWWFGPDPLLIGVPDLSRFNSGAHHLITADRVKTGKEHKIWNRMQRMPTLAGKIKVIYHYLAATRAVTMSCPSPSFLEYTKTWFSIMKEIIRSWKRDKKTK